MRFLQISIYTTIGLVCFSLSSCEQLDKMAKKNWEKKYGKLKSADFQKVEKWKETLAVNEAELRALDQSIQKMVKSTAQAGALSRRIAQAYMRASNFEMGLRYYQKAAEEMAGREVANGAIQQSRGQPGKLTFWDSSLPYFEKAILFSRIDKELLFEMGLAYANSSKNMGWEPERRRRAIEIFTNLIRYDPNDSRFPYQLALIYFDSSVSGATWSLQEEYRDEEKAFRLLDEILKKERENVPARFAKANFLYRIGETERAYSEYRTIKSTIEEIARSGGLREPLEKNSSYQNVLRNLKEIESRGIR